MEEQIKFCPDAGRRPHRDTSVAPRCEQVSYANPRRSAWCSKYLPPAGMQVSGYGRLPISDQSLHSAFLGDLCASSAAGGETRSLGF
jgi:hypothetical protein